MKDFTDLELGFLIGCMISIKNCTSCSKEQRDMAIIIQEKLEHYTSERQKN